nr:hypothetical protein L203_06363 [Cryptococcus depauperatus CBS 7841]
MNVCGTMLRVYIYIDQL